MKRLYVFLLALALVAACNEASEVDSPDGGGDGSGQSGDTGDTANTDDTDNEGETGSTDTDPVGTDTPCGQVPPSQCAARSDCAPINASPIDPVRKCTGPSEPVACREADMDCDDSTTVAVDGAGKCWFFGCLNVPDTMQDIFQSESEMIETCGVSYDDDLGRCEDPLDCKADELETAHGCKSCSEAHGEAGAAVEDARHNNGYDKCERDADCTTVFAGTKCQGTCQSAVASISKEAFLSEVERISEDYCGAENHDQLCGYATPDCMEATPVCRDRRCAVEFGR